MKKKSLSDALNETIILLENKQARELIILKEQFHITYESLKPINMLKSTFHEIISSPDIKNNIVNNVIGLATGYVSKKVLMGATRNPLKKIAGFLLEFAIANVVSKHSNNIKSTGKMIVENIFGYSKKTEKIFSENGE